MKGTRHLELTTAGSAGGEGRVGEGRRGRVKGVGAVCILYIYAYICVCTYVLRTYVVYIDNVHKSMLSYCEVLVRGRKWL